MGSFIGHVDEAMFFLMAAVWWMCIMFPRYIRSIRGGPSYRNQLSYGLPCCNRIPIEAIIKTLFPICGFIGELANGPGPHFIDKQGHFQKLNGLQHMTIYGMFTLHGISDILTFYKVKAIPPDFEYITGAMSFAWYGLSFQFHARMPNKEPLETIIHILPTYIIFLVAIVIGLMIWKKHVFLLDIIRIWSLLVLGTWFIHTSFIMYIPWGGKRNTSWDRSDHHNVHFVVAAFGAHCCLHIVTVMVVYAITYMLVTRKSIHTGSDISLNHNKGYTSCAIEECETLIET